MCHCHCHCHHCARCSQRQTWWCDPSVPDNIHLCQAEAKHATQSVKPPIREALNGPARRSDDTTESDWQGPPAHCQVNTRSHVALQTARRQPDTQWCVRITRWELLHCDRWKWSPSTRRKSSASFFMKEYIRFDTKVYVFPNPRGLDLLLC